MGSGGPVWAGSKMVGAPRHPISAPCWTEYEGCRSAQTFEAHLRRSPGSIFCDRSVTGPSVRTFETGLGHLL